MKINLKGTIVSKIVKEWKTSQYIVFRLATGDTNWDGSQEIIEVEWWGNSKENVRNAKAGDKVDIRAYLNSKPSKDGQRFFYSFKGFECEVTEACTSPLKKVEEDPVESPVSDDDGEYPF